jgi:WD40 repeat protein
MLCIKEGIFFILFAFILLVSDLLYAETKSEILLQALNAHTGEVQAVAFSPAGDYFVSGGIDGKVNVWSFPNFELINSSQSHNSSIVSVAFSQDSTLLLSASRDGIIKIWSLLIKDNVTVIQSTYSLTFANFSPDKQYIIAGDSTGEMHFWQRTTGKLRKSIRNENSKITGFVYPPDKMQFITGYENGDITLWSGTLLSPIKSIPAHKLPIRHMFFTTFAYAPEIKDLTLITNPKQIRQIGSFVTVADDKLVKCWSQKNYSLIGKSQFTSEIINITSPEKADYFISINSDGTIKYFGFRTEQLSFEDKENTEFMKDFPVSEDKMMIKARLKFPELKEIMTSDLPVYDINVINFSPDGKYIITGDKSGSVSLLKNPLLIKQYKMLLEAGENAFSANKYDLATVNFSQAISIYSEEEAKEKLKQAREKKLEQQQKQQEKLREMQKKYREKVKK